MGGGTPGVVGCLDEAHVWFGSSGGEAGQEGGGFDLM